MGVIQWQQSVNHDQAVIYHAKLLFNLLALILHYVDLMLFIRYLCYSLFESQCASLYAFI